MEDTAAALMDEMAPQGMTPAQPDPPPKSSPKSKKSSGKGKKKSPAPEPAPEPEPATCWSSLSQPLESGSALVPLQLPATVRLPLQRGTLRSVYLHLRSDKLRGNGATAELPTNF